MSIKRAKELIDRSQAILITAGAGIGVDSGLPDFRGVDGFWRAYPKAKELNLSFEELANPKWFESDPYLAWAFYGHRLNLYKKTTPHMGFEILKELVQKKEYFIFTSNVDGQFQKIGFDREKIMECHGSIHYLQCIQNCQKEIWQDIELKIKINDENFKALDPLPICPHCHSLARPNILMFGDFWFEPKRVSGQSQRFESWLDKISSKQLSLAIIEIGAGTAVPTVRNLSENLSKRFQTPLIRINPRESFGANIAIELGAKEALEKIINL